MSRETISSCDLESSTNNSRNFAFVPTTGNNERLIKWLIILIIVIAIPLITTLSVISAERKCFFEKSQNYTNNKLTKLKHHFESLVNKTVLQIIRKKLEDDVVNYR